MPLELQHFEPCKKDFRENLVAIPIDKLQHIDGFVNKYKSLICANEYNEQEQVIYFIALGYQNKGMKKEFYELYKNDTFYYKLEDVENAYQYLTTDMQNKVKNLQKNFRENFINNFTAGRSILAVSW
jgi:hypothetical protein